MSDWESSAVYTPPTKGPYMQARKPPPTTRARIESALRSLCGGIGFRAALAVYAAAAAFGSWAAGFVYNDPVALDSISLKMGLTTLVGMLAGIVVAAAVLIRADHRQAS